MPAQKQVDKYELDERFERAVVFLACSAPRFWGRIGHALDSASMPSEPAALAVQAARAVAKDLSRGPDNATLVMQRLKRWHEDGKVTHEQVLAVGDMLDQAEEDGLPEVESIITEIAPILKRRAEHTAIIAAMESYGQRKNLDAAVDMIVKARALGVQDESIGVRMGGDSFAIIDQLRSLVRLPSGVRDLDELISGGLPRGQLGMFVGGPGAGKSMCLSHLAASAAMNGVCVAYATLELPEAIVLARIKAAITRVPIDAIMAGGERSDTAKAALEATPVCPLYVRYFTPQVTTVDDMTSWLKRLDDSAGRPIDLLIVDYADKLTDPKRSKEQGAYKTMELVYESLRILAVDRNMWSWTASQATRRSKKDSGESRSIDLEHTADSLHKVRVADLVVTLNYDDERNEMVFFVAKNRTGAGRKHTSPVPVDFSIGQVSPLQPPVTDGKIAGEAILVDQVTSVLVRKYDDFF